MFFFFFNDTATTEIYTLSLHDALPISTRDFSVARQHQSGDYPMPQTYQVTCSQCGELRWPHLSGRPESYVCVRCRSGDRKSTRLNSSHLVISYAVFCLKKKKTTIHTYI